MKLCVPAIFSFVAAVIQLQAQSAIPGSLDTSFETGEGFDGYVKALAIQADGKVIAGGMFSNYKGSPAPKIARLLPNGDLDPTFNPGTGPDGEVNLVFFTNDEKILIGGNFYSINGVVKTSLARLNSDGTLDTNYLGVIDQFSLLDADLQRDGRLLIAGTFQTVNGKPWKYFARLNEDGTLDESFGPFGSVLTAWPQAVKAQPDGKILVSNSRYKKDNVQRDFLFRLNPDGSIDESFDSHGVIFAADILELLPDGSILADWFTLNRLFPDGTYDSVFEIRDPFPNAAIPLQDGRILAHQSANTPAVFYSDGSLHFELGSKFDRGIKAAVAGPNGTLYLGGDFVTVDAQKHQAIARIHLDDRTAPARIQWNGTNFAALEAHGKVALPLLRTGQTNSTLTVHITTSETSGDFIPVNEVMTFHPGESLRYVEVQLVDDSFPEADERFQITVAAEDASFSDTATFQIISDEGFLEFASGGETVDELSRTAVVQTRKIGAIPYSITAPLSNKGGDLDPNEDVSWFSRSVTLKEGVDTNIINISILDDRLAEVPETLEIELGEPSGNHAQGGQTSFVLTVLDNDRPGIPGEGLDAPSQLLAEPEGGLLIFGDFRSVHGFRKERSARLDQSGLLSLTNFTAHRPESGGFVPVEYKIVPLVALPGGKSLHQVLYSNRTSFDARFGFMRLNKDGSRDVSFSTNTTFSANELHSISPGMDSKILLVESTNSSGRRNFALRLIGSTGQVEQAITGRIFPRFTTASKTPRAARQSTGHILVAGDIYGLTNNTPNPAELFAYGKNVIRFNPDGTPDRTFASSVEAPIGWTIQALEVLPDDRILLAGNFSKAGGLSNAPLARLQANGELDSNFAADFSFMTNPFVITGMEPLQSGNLLLRLSSAGQDFLVQLNQNGSRDLSFPIRTFATGELVSIVELSDGRLALSGTFREVDGVPRGRLAYLSPGGELLPDQPLELTSIEKAGSTLELNIATRVSGTVEIQASNDLVSWSPIHTAPVNAGSQKINSGDISGDYQFVRAVLQQ